MSDIGQQVRNARRVSTPIVAVNTPDPAATIKAICAAIEGAKEIPKAAWDVVQGIQGLNPPGEEFARDNTGTEGSAYAAFTMARKLPAGGVLFIHMAPRFLGEPMEVQALWNLRDQFKANQRMIVLLGKQIALPAELVDDVTTFDEPLPTESELASIVDKQYANAELTRDLTARDKAVEALRGLSAFAAEQVTAMSLTKSGINLDRCWDRKRQQIEQTPGLKVYRGTSSFENIGGCDTIKDFLTRILAGKSRPNAIVFVDEIEKTLGSRGDTSGVSQDQLGTLLSYMQDHNAAGCIFVGPPGTAKSEVAKSAGTQAGVPTVQLDLGAAKGSLVGQSERQLRDALKVITAVANARSLWIATCNAITELPPELRRRFTLGTFFFDLPSFSERRQIWELYIERYFPNLIGYEDRLDCSRDINDEGWTGAEIKQCCDIAWRLGCSLKDASGFVVPVSRSAATQLDQLRAQADGRFLCASRGGVYQRQTTLKAPTGRAIQLEE